MKTAETVILAISIVFKDFQQNALHAVILAIKLTWSLFLCYFLQVY